MHAAIISDAMRVPWVPLITSGQINTFKWLDWTKTVNLPYMPIVLGSSSLKEFVRDKLLFLYGEKYYVPSLTEKAVLNKFKIHRLMKSNFLWRYYFKAAKILFYKIPMILVSMLGARFVSRKDENFINLATEKLSEAIVSKAYLSQDSIFFDNQKKLEIALSNVVKKYTE
ncbi:hypothetical protein CK506_15050 [Klebsiella pneumoniae]|nr:hypothetical protein CK506_15050 [Klebsiella pneumoniae]